MTHRPGAVHPAECRAAPRLGRCLLPSPRRRPSRPRSTYDGCWLPPSSAIGGVERPGQVEMAEAVETAMRDGGHLLVQAGTGTGKSLAYLVPALLHPGPVVVATATIALQKPGRRPRPAGPRRRGRATAGPAADVRDLEGPVQLPVQEQGVRRDAGRRRDRGPVRRVADDRPRPQVVQLRGWAEETETGDRDELTPGRDRPGLATGQRVRARSASAPASARTARSASPSCRVRAPPRWTWW